MRLLFTFCIFLFAVGCSAPDESPTNTSKGGVQAESPSELRYDARLSQFAYPFPTKTFPFSTQGQELEMAYMDLRTEAREGEAPVVVLLHGKNFSGFYWERIAKDLRTLGYRVIIPDQIGFGKSSKPKHYQYSFAQLALNTKKLLESLDIETYALVGHSMGGMLATTMSNQYEYDITQTILINPIGLETYSLYAEAKDPNFFYDLEYKKSANGIREYQRKNYYDGQWSDSYEALILPTIGQIAHEDWPRVAWNNALTYGPIFAEDGVEKIRNLSVPTSIILGTRDRTGPGRGWKKANTTYKFGEYHRFKNRLITINPEVEVLELNELGHLPHFEDYKRFSEVFYSMLDIVE